MQQPTAREQLERRLPPAVRFVISIVAVALAFVITMVLYDDHTPHATVALVMSMNAPVRTVLAEGCAEAGRLPAREAVNRARVLLPDPRLVRAASLAPNAGGEVILALTMYEVRWGAPWRAWMTAITDGSTLVWSGRCAGAGSIDWRITPSTTVPARFLPRRQAG